MIDVALDDRPISRYMLEILAHAGLPWRELTAAEVVSRPPAPGILVLSGRDLAARALTDWLTAFVRSGGALIGVGGLWGLGDLFGARETGPVQADGYLRVDPAHPISAGLTSSLHVFDVAPLQVTTGATLGTVRDNRQARGIGDAIVMQRLGRGCAVAIAADLAASIHRIQHGTPVHVDGVPAPDGTAPIDEGILKCDDGLVLTWEFDRAQTPPAELDPDCPGIHPNYPAGDTPWFSQPIADELRALLLQTVCWIAAEIGVPLPFVWAWPRRLPAVGLISHDSDFNIDATARMTLRLVEEAGIRTTWCMMEGPTYPDHYLPETFVMVEAAGHETALHYNALEADGGTWGQAHLHAQANWLRRITGNAPIASNKNHFTRWEGDVEFYRWLEEEGIGSDQTKGPSKKGNVGFPNGSCLPWFPYDLARERMIDVLEIPMQTQDLWWTTPHTVSLPILDQVVKHHGIAHFLFHQVHLDWRPPVAQAMLRVVADGRERGLEWWTSGEIAAWERLRRSVSLSIQSRTEASIQLDVTSPRAMSGFGVALVVPGLGDRTVTASVAGRPVAVSTIDCHNQPAQLLAWDLPAGTSAIDIRW